MYVFVKSFEVDDYSNGIKAMAETRQRKEFATAWVVKIKDGREIKEGEAVIDKEDSVPQKEKAGNIVTEYIDNPPMTPITRPQHLGNTPPILSTFRKRDGKNMNTEIK